MGRTYLHFFRLLIFRSIVHDNFPIFGTKVYLAMPNAVLTFHHQKSLPFLNAKMFFFVYLQFSHKIDHIGWTIPNFFIFLAF